VHRTSGKTIGPISSYALALWGLQGLLYPNDIITRNGQRRFLAGYLPGMMPFIRNNGHLHRAKLWAVAGGKGGVGKSVFFALWWEWLYRAWIKKW
jgi:hypothetical protein